MKWLDDMLDNFIKRLQQLEYSSGRWESLISESDSYIRYSIFQEDVDIGSFKKLYSKYYDATTHDRQVELDRILSSYLLDKSINDYDEEDLLEFVDDVLKIELLIKVFILERSARNGRQHKNYKLLIQRKVEEAAGKWGYK